MVVESFAFTMTGRQMGIMNRIMVETIISERVKIPRPVVSACLQEFQEVIIEAMLKDEIVRMVGFGVFFARRQKARRGRNPSNGKPVDIPASRKPAFRPGKNLVETINLGATAKSKPAKRPRPKKTGR